MREDATWLGLRLVTKLQRAGLSMRELARRTHVPLSTIQKICKGAGKQTSVWTILALAEELDVSVDSLIRRPPSSHP